ncbi:MAG: tetratricopeptide repeat protein, partial [Nocardioidaceae bacterium]|nr:tetratricopeptide repeat protein [Nocardioidaceae bacterium]
MRGLAHSQRALLLMRAGNGQAAIDAFGAAEALLGDEPEPVVRLHLNRGNVYLQRGDWSQAAVDLERAVHLAETADLPIQRAKAAHNLGYTHLLRGDLVQALTLIDGARAVLDDVSPFLEAVGLQDRAEVLVAGGM